MKTIRIKGVERDFCIDSGTINSINIKNPKYFFSLYNSLVEEDEETFQLYDDYKSKNVFDDSLIILNPFDINPNNKKILNAFYKKISTKLIDKENEDSLMIIREKINELINQISLKLDVATDYDIDFPIASLLSICDYSFKEDIKDYVEKIVFFLKANLEIKNFSVIISINLLPLLDECEFNMFKKELEYMNLSLVNINLVNNLINDDIKTVNIDMDLCEY